MTDIIRNYLPNKEQELRRCPFCGGEAVLDEFENDHIIGWFGRCLECNASMPYAISKPIAVKQWNRRSSDEQAEVVGWVDWHGGECPVAPDATVEAKLRHGGPTHVARASGLSWKHGNIHGPTMDSDIVSYRVLASPPAVAAGGVTAQNAQAALHLLRMMDDEIRRIPDKPDPVVKNNIGYYAQQLRAALAVGDEGIREDDTIRVCPERDARCPHGMSCPYNHDRYRCDMIGSRAALKDTTHAE